MTDRAVLTTGANSGIGLATVLAVAEAGFRSIGTVRSEAKAEIVSRAAQEAGVDVETMVLDVTDEEGCAQVVGQFELYGLVNNAGYTNMGAIEDVADDDARHQFETMVVAPMRLARLALPGMRERGEGRIVNVSSIYGRASTPLSGWYQASKHALEAVSDALRMEVAASGVHVVLIEPGGFRTGIWEEMEHDVEVHTPDSAYADAYRRSVELTRRSQALMGDPVQVAAVVRGALLAGRPRARYLVGRDAQAIALWNRYTPTAVKDRVIRLALGL
jgi:NAD(P)-dependent dehydrogenase (short-subunit alcohol dehydrogenase family)